MSGKSSDQSRRPSSGRAAQHRFLWTPLPVLEVAQPQHLRVEQQKVHCSSVKDVHGVGNHCVGIWPGQILDVRNIMTWMPLQQKLRDSRSSRKQNGKLSIGKRGQKQRDSSDKINEILQGKDLHHQLQLSSRGHQGSNLLASQHQSLPHL